MKTISIRALLPSKIVIAVIKKDYYILLLTNIIL